MQAEPDLIALLRQLCPRLRAGAYVYTIVPDAIPPGAVPVVSVCEDEGLTLILPQQQADDLGLPYDFVAAWITLQVCSALSAVGLTAAVSRVLTEAGISANVVAGLPMITCSCPMTGPTTPSAPWPPSLPPAEHPTARSAPRVAQRSRTSINRSKLSVAAGFARGTWRPHSPAGSRTKPTRRGFTVVMLSPNRFSPSITSSLGWADSKGQCIT
ncbi:MAG: ACT domain-containing protein [Pseudonocardiaceae bacterium]